MTPIIIPAVGLALALALRNKKAKKSEIEEIEEFEIVEEELPLMQTPKTPSPQVWRGKYSNSVKVNEADIKGFSASATLARFKIAILRGDILGIKSLASNLNTARIRALHNEFLEQSKGSVTLYQFINKSSFPELGKTIAYGFLNNAGVGSQIRRV